MMELFSYLFPQSGKRWQQSNVGKQIFKLSFLARRKSISRCLGSDSPEILFYFLLYKNVNVLPPGWRGRERIGKSMHGAPAQERVAFIAWASGFRIYQVHILHVVFLGDIQCSWTESYFPSVSDNLSHT